MIAEFFFGGLIFDDKIKKYTGMENEGGQPKIPQSSKNWQIFGIFWGNFCEYSVS